MALIALANELILLVFESLDDHDLLILGQVSRRLHAIALHIFLCRHGISKSDSDTQEGHISVTSQSLPGICMALNLPSFKKLDCAFDGPGLQSDISALTSFISGKPPVEEVSVFCTSSAELDVQNAQDFFLKLLAVIPGRLENVLFLYRSSFEVSKHRWFMRRDPFEDSFTFNCNLVRDIQAGFTWATSMITDPMARKFQTERLQQDVNFSSVTPLLGIQVKHPVIPEGPFSRWTVVVFDPHSITRFKISVIPAARGKWGHILPSIRLPSLQLFEIGCNMNLDYSTFLEFVRRHPTILSLRLQHFSVYYGQVPFPLNLLPSLRAISASARHVVHILQSTEHYPHLHTVGIGTPAPKLLAWVRRVDPSAKVELPFDFEMMNKALALLATLPTSNLKLDVQIPGAMASRQWLTGLEVENIARRMHNVRFVNLRTELNKRMHPDMFPLLPRWFASFPSIRTVAVNRYVCLFHQLDHIKDLLHLHPVPASRDVCILSGLG